MAAQTIHQIKAMHVVKNTALTDNLASGTMSTIPRFESACLVTTSIRHESSEQQLQRQLVCVLNKACAKNELKIARCLQTLAEVRIQSVNDLALTAELLLGRSLAEPQYCEIYATMVATLRRHMPEFPASRTGGKSVTFRQVFLDTVQSEFESMSNDLKVLCKERNDLHLVDICPLRKQREDRFLAMVRFCGHLFLQRCLSTTSIGFVINDLAMCGNVVPMEHCVECLCKLLKDVSYMLGDSRGKMTISNAFSGEHIGVLFASNGEAVGMIRRAIARKLGLSASDIRLVNALGAVLEDSLLLAEIEAQHFVESTPTVSGAANAQRVVLIDFLDIAAAGRAALASAFRRLRDLKRRLAMAGRRASGLYSKRVQFAIQDVLDMCTRHGTKTPFHGFPAFRNPQL